ncbi:MAG: NAD(P)/FAD-dependent oxidoreductase [Candidatus Lokiarchaeota archaeon]|nr:NAD(P)/FAD-dependent oxidoreductase [Candidatus Harpocratesius repetitus]
MSKQPYDIAIIGGGVIGAAIAQRLAKYQLSLVLIEKEEDVAMGTSKANSGIIHQGYFTTKGSLKESLSLRSNKLFDEVCPQLDVEFKRIGAIFCATNEKELKTLEGEFKESRERNVAVELVQDRDRIQEIEPQLNDQVIAVLHFPNAGIITPWELTIAMVEHSIINGLKLHLGFEVAYIKREKQIFQINSVKGQKIEAKTIINAAGVYSDSIAKMIGDDSFNIIPRRGEYIMFDKNSLQLNKIIFPTPNVVSKGIVVAPTMHNNFFVGPNANEIDSKEGINTTTQGLNEILQGGLKLVKKLPIRKHITNFAGIRASTITHDFIIGVSKLSQFVNVAGIDSPGLTSSLGIAEYVEKILQNDCGYKFIEKRNYIPTRKNQIRYAQLSESELAEKIKENPQWGNMICRCELVTEAEIVEACHGLIPITNTDMIKRRLRPGMGRCQGGFCLPKVMKIISRERGVIYEQVTKTGRDSHIVFKRTKNLCSEVFQGDQL